ncbi:MAG: DUF302 domain-containing protein [Anaerolineae bacterium]
MTKTQQSLGFKVIVRSDYQTALTRAVEALKAEGFGILTEIDVQATMKAKLNVDFRPYKILGACNPPLAYRALTAAPEIGLLLPCNVTVTQEGEGAVHVSLVDPWAMMRVVDNPALAEIAQEARERLSRVAKALENA